MTSKVKRAEILHGKFAKALLFLKRNQSFGVMAEQLTTDEIILNPLHFKMVSFK